MGIDVEVKIKKTSPSSEFYWAFGSSLIVAIAIAIYQLEQIIVNDPQNLLNHSARASAFSFSLLLFLLIYFIVGVIMLFIKKSEKFSKGLLLSALLIMLIMFLVPRLIHV
jgi:predicted lysophospholipase L1 biosynthesis ABC-type transport system permease subunit